MFECVYVCVAMPCGDPHVMSKAGMFVCVCMYACMVRVEECIGVSGCGDTQVR